MQQKDLKAMAQMAIKTSTKPGTFAGMSSENVAAALAPYAEQIRRALPNGGNPDRIIQSAVFQITTNPALAECSAKSIVGAVLNCSLLDLNPALKEVHFIPRWNSKAGQNEVSFEIDYKGLLKLARRSPQVASVWAEVVYENDRFNYQRGTDPKIEHQPVIGERGKVIAAYAVARLNNGLTEFLVMSEAEIEKRRKVSPSQKGNADAVGVWLAWGDEMRKKTVLRGLCKLLPLSTQMQHAVNADQTTMEPEQFYNGEVVGVAEYDEALDAVVVEAGDLQKIRDGVQDCMDVDALEAYWKQNADEWKSRPDVKAVFGERKKQLNG